MRDRRTAMQRFRQGAISAVGSVKIKLLVCSCIALSVFALVSRTADSMRWSRRTDNLDIYPVSRRGYNIVINTWKRNDLLKQSVSHYALCSGLDSIHIVWSEPDPPSESLIKFLHHVVHSNSRDGRKIVLKFDINKEDSLNNRFKEIKDLKTDAVFSIDDDIIFPCSSVEFAFNVWQSAPDTMVGFVPRMHWIDQSAIQVPMFMLDGGLFGGQVHTVWYFRRQLFSIKSISVCIRMRCQPQSENLQPKIGTVKILQCHSLLQM